MTGKMNPEAKRLWVAALRSGRYTQGREYLNCAGRFCCLGVLCETAIENGLRVDYNEIEDTKQYDGCSDFPPLAVRRWAGLASFDPTVPKPAELMPFRCGYSNSPRPHVALSDLNDDYGYDFNKIADLIEEHL